MSCFPMAHSCAVGLMVVGRSAEEGSRTTNRGKKAARGDAGGDSGGGSERTGSSSFTSQHGFSAREPFSAGNYTRGGSCSGNLVVRIRWNESWSTIPNSRSPRRLVEESLGCALKLIIIWVDDVAFAVARDKLRVAPFSELRVVQAAVNPRRLERQRAVRDGSSTTERGVSR